MMTLAIASGIAALFLSTVCLVVSCLALGMVYGLRNSIHKIVQGPWSSVPQPQEDEYINSDDSPNESPVLDDHFTEEIQDLPAELKPKRPKTLMEQMKEHMYPDIEDEQV